MAPIIRRNVRVKCAASEKPAAYAASATDVPRVRSHEHGAGRDPALALPLAEVEGSVEGHDELDAVMPMHVSPRPGAQRNSAAGHANAEAPT